MGHKVEIVVDIYSGKIIKMLINGKETTACSITFGSWLRDEIVIRQGNSVTRIKAYVVGLA